MHTTRGLEGVESGVLELPAQEVIGECFGSREVFCRQVLLAWLCAAILHIGGAVQKAADVKAVIRVLYLVGRRGEVPRQNTLFTDGAHVLLDLVVNHDVELAVLAHFLEDLMLVCAQRVLKSDFSLTLNGGFRKNHVTDET